MAALLVSEIRTERKSAMGLALQFNSFLFLIPAVHLAAGQTQIQESRQGLIWAGCFVTLGWLLQQWEAGRWPQQSRILALWQTRWGNLFLSLLLAGALALLSLVTINALLWLLIK